MKIVVLYDIENDKVRKSIIEILSEFGLHRIQKSLFIGNIKSILYSNFLKSLEKKITVRDKLCVIPLSENSYNNIQTLGECKEEIIGSIRNFYVKIV